jgi:hypothetical protein
MSTFFVFLGILLVSLVVSFLAALQLADFFLATEEFIAVMMALVAFNFVALLIFAAAYAAVRRVGGLAAVAVLLCVAALVLVALPSIMDMQAGRGSLADSFRGKNLAVSLELLVPAVIAILVQWGLTRHRWLRMRGHEDLSPWPWVTTVIAGLIVLNPLGLNVMAAAFEQSATDWFRQFWTWIAAAGAVAVLVFGWVEYYIRGRMLSRRLGAGP